MRPSGKLYIIAVMGLVLTGCPPPCEYSLIELGTLSAEEIAYSPYVDGQTYCLVHSEGHKITFLASRTREMQIEQWSECSERSYETDLTTFSPDYPLFSCNIGIYKRDSAYSECLINAGGSSFWFPPSIETDRGHSYFDSIQIGLNWYHEVYKMGNNWWDGNPEGQIQADSLYYNTSYGILKILMTNGEYYEICR